MKYVVIDDNRGDIFTAEYQTAEQAIEEAKNQYNHKTAGEKKQSKIYVLESVNPDEEAVDHLDGNVIYTAKEDRNMKTVMVHWIAGLYVEILVLRTPKPPVPTVPKVRVSASNTGMRIAIRITASTTVITR